MRFTAMRRNRFWILAGIVALVCCLTVMPALATSEGGHSEGGHGETASKGWVNTDTYRVVNFAILFIALFLLLKKPVANALNARIKGIQDQLSELESQKADAEKKLAEYNEKLARLDDEAKQIV